MLGEARVLDEPDQLAVGAAGCDVDDRADRGGGADAVPGPHIPGEGCAAVGVDAGTGSTGGSGHVVDTRPFAQFPLRGRRLVAEGSVRPASEDGSVGVCQGVVLSVTDSEDAGRGQR